MQRNQILDKLPVAFVLALLLGLCLQLAYAFENQEWDRLMVTGQSLASGGDFAKAERCFDRALSIAVGLPEKDPRLITSLSAKAKCLFLENKYPESENLWWRAKTLADAQGNVLIQEAVLRGLTSTMANRHNLKETLPIYKQLFSIEPQGNSLNSASDHLRLARLYAENKLYSLSVEQFKLSLLPPDPKDKHTGQWNAIAEYDLAKLYRTSGDYVKDEETLVDLLNKNIGFQPDEARQGVLVLLGHACAHQEKVGQAESYYQRAIEMAHLVKVKDWTIEAHTSRGWLYVREKRYPLAKSDFERAVALCGAPKLEKLRQSGLLGLKQIAKAQKATSGK